MITPRRLTTFILALCSSGLLLALPLSAHAQQPNVPSTQHTNPSQLLADTTINLRDKAATTLPGIPDSYDADDSSVAFGSFIAQVLNIVFTVSVILVFFYLIWGAFEWITAGGDSGKLSSARNRIIQAIIGLIVLSATVAILVLVQSFLNVCVIQFGDSCTPPPPRDPLEGVGFCGGGAVCNGLPQSTCQVTQGCVWTQAN